MHSMYASIDVPGHTVKCGTKKRVHAHKATMSVAPMLIVEGRGSYPTPGSAVPLGNTELLRKLEELRH